VFLTICSSSMLKRPTARIMALTDIFGGAALCRVLHLGHEIIGGCIFLVVLISCSVSSRVSRSRIICCQDIDLFQFALRIAIISGNHTLFALPDAKGYPSMVLRITTKHLSVVRTARTLDYPPTLARTTDKCLLD
jgi:hypothetical protein